MGDGTVPVCRVKRETSSFYALQDFNTNSFCQKVVSVEL